jgi:hypothetical protein
VPLAGRAREDGTAARPVAGGVEQGAQLRTDDLGGGVLLADPEVAVLPAVADPPQRRPDHVADCDGRRVERERVVHGPVDPRRLERGDRVHDLVHEVADPDRGRLEARPAEEPSGLADAEPLSQARLQPLDTQHVVLRVAPVGAGRPLRLQHAVALLPLAKRRGGNAGLPRDRLDVHAAAPRRAACRNFPPMTPLLG